MKEVEFIWDEKKNAANIKKHGIDFQEAATVFFDDYAILFDDPDHSQDEERFLILGFSYRLRLLIVCHCYRKNEKVIRLISARKATNNERKWYEGV